MWAHFRTHWHCACMCLFAQTEAHCIVQWRWLYSSECENNLSWVAFFFVALCVIRALLRLRHFCSLSFVSFVLVFHRPPLLHSFVLYSLVALVESSFSVFSFLVWVLSLSLLLPSWLSVFLSDEEHCAEKKSRVHAPSKRWVYLTLFPILIYEKKNVFVFSICDLSSFPCACFTLFAICLFVCLCHLVL